MTTSDEQIFAIATANRRLAADMFAGLTDDQWRTPSLCAGWTVREVAAHLVPPEGGIVLLSLAGRMIRYRGNLDRMVDETARTDARRPTADILADLRARAGVRMKAPVIGAAGPMSDTAIHLRDAARPLGLPVNPEPPAWRPVLDFLVSPAAVRGGFLPKGRLAGLRFVVTDEAWTWGSGAEVVGTSEAVAMAMAGRPAALPGLHGAGVETLRSRLPA